MRFTWGVIVGLAIQGGLSQTSAPAEGELTLRQDTGVPDTEVPPTDVVEPPVVSDTPPVQTNPVESPAADPTPTDVAPPQVTASEAPGSNTEPAGDASSVGTVPLETPIETIPATAPEQTPAQTQTGGELTPDTPVGTGSQAPPPPQPTPSEGPVTASAQGGESTAAATGAADNTEAADDTAVASETRAPGQTPTRGEEPTSVVNSAVQSAVPSAISSAIESAITSAIRSAEQASTFAEEVSTVAGIVTTIGDVETTIEGVRTITNKAPASDGSSGGTTLTTRPAATSTVSVPVSLQSASVGDNAVVKQVDGKPAVVLSPPAGGQASFEVTAAKPQAVKEKDLVRVKANVTLTESTGGTGQAKDDPCNVNMNVNGKSVYNKDLSAGTTNGPFEITSDFFEAASGDQDIKMTQKCGQNPQQMTVNGMSLQGQVRAESGSGNGGSGGSGGSETSSADGSQSTGKDNASSSNKPAMFALGLVAALAVFVM